MVNTFENHRAFPSHNLVLLSTGVCGKMFSYYDGLAVKNTIEDAPICRTIMSVHAAYKRMKLITNSKYILLGLKTH